MGGFYSWCLHLRFHCFRNHLRRNFVLHFSHLHPAHSRCWIDPRHIDYAFPSGFQLCGLFPTVAQTDPYAGPLLHLIFSNIGRRESCSRKTHPALRAPLPRGDLLSLYFFAFLEFFRGSFPFCDFCAFLSETPSDSGRLKTSPSPLRDPRGLPFCRRPSRRLNTNRKHEGSKDTKNRTLNLLRVLRAFVLKMPCSAFPRFGTF